MARICKQQTLWLIQTWRWWLWRSEVIVTDTSRRLQIHFGCELGFGARRCLIVPTPLAKKEKVPKGQILPVLHRIEAEK